MFQPFRFLLLALFCAGSAHAQNALTKAEQAPVCRSAKACADLVERHSATEFDYSLIARDVSRLGKQGESLLIGLATSPKTAKRAFALAGQPTLAPPLREAVLERFPVPDPELHIRLGKRYTSEALRRRAISALNTPARETAIRALATQTQAMPPQAAQAALPQLARANRERPSAAVTRLIAQAPDGAPELVKALGANDADVIATAYLALEKLNAELSRADLEAAFRASPASHAGAWTQALEILGRSSQSFDAIGFGYANYRDTKLSPTHRAVMLHSALLYPGGAERKVGSEASGLVAELVKLPVSDRLADTAPSHPLFADPRQLRAFLAVWQGRDTESSARFARAIGQSRIPGSRAVLRDMFAKTPDYRVQVAVVEALAEMGVEDAGWLRTVTLRHPIHEVRDAGAKALKVKLPTAAAACLTKGSAWTRTPEAMPYFQSGRYADGRTPGRWELVDAKAFPKGWLAAYRGGLIRYGSDDTAELLDVAGRPAAILADPVETGQARPTGFWILTKGETTARLYRFSSRKGLGAASTLPKSARIVKLPEQGYPGLRGWAIAFDSAQPTLTVTRDGRIQPVCNLPQPSRG